MSPHLKNWKSEFGRTQGLYLENCVLADLWTIFFVFMRETHSRSLSTCFVYILYSNIEAYELLECLYFTKHLLQTLYSSRHIFTSYCSHVPKRQQSILQSKRRNEQVNWHTYVEAMATLEPVCKVCGTDSADRSQSTVTSSVNTTRNVMFPQKAYVVSSATVSSPYGVRITFRPT
jgi:hypothetical protein